MTALIIIGVIFALLTVIALIKVCAVFSLDDAVSFKVTILNFVLFEYPTLKKIKVEPDGTARYGKAEKKQGYFAKLKEKEGFFSALKTVIKLVGAALRKTAGLLKKTEIERIKLHILVADDDSAKTALMYSGVCSLVYPLLSFIECNIKSIKKDIKINADFDSTSFETEVYIKANLRIIHLVIFAVSLLYEYVKIISKKEGA